jgi:hypothetical protein
MPWVEEEEGPQDSSQSPKDECADMLTGHLNTAAGHIQKANETIAQWRPVQIACKAALKALQEEAKAADAAKAPEGGFS